jgi:predicted ester cyclase
MDATELVRAHNDYWNKDDKDSFIALFTESCEITTPGDLILRGLAGAEMFWEAWHSAFPDSHLTIRNIFGTDNQVAMEATFEGNHTGTLQTPDGSQIPPTGKHVSTPYVAIFTVQGDEIAAKHLYFDQIRVLTQLDLMAASGA